MDAVGESVVGAGVDAVGPAVVGTGVDAVGASVVGVSVGQPVGAVVAAVGEPVVGTGVDAVGPAVVGTGVLAVGASVVGAGVVPAQQIASVHDPLVQTVEAALCGGLPYVQEYCWLSAERTTMARRIERIEVAISRT